MKFSPQEIIKILETPLGRSYDDLDERVLEQRKRVSIKYQELNHTRIWIPRRNAWLVPGFTYCSLEARSWWLKEYMGWDYDNSIIIRFEIGQTIIPLDLPHEDNTIRQIVANHKNCFGIEQEDLDHLSYFTEFKADSPPHEPVTTVIDPYMLVKPGCIYYVAFEKEISR